MEREINPFDVISCNKKALINCINKCVEEQCYIADIESFDGRFPACIVRPRKDDE